MPGAVCSELPAIFRVLMLCSSSHFTTDVGFGRFVILMSRYGLLASWIAASVQRSPGDAKFLAILIVPSDCAV